MQNMIWIVAAFWGYLWGSLSSAVIVCRLMRLPDPRTRGSGNPGATNVLRIGGKLPAAITLAGDLLKGLLPVLIVRSIWPDAQTAWLVTGLAAFIGHIIPVFFAFKGGKGVATALGVLLGWNLFLGLALSGIWLCVFVATRVSSLSALCAAFCAPWIAFVMFDDQARPIMVIAMVALLVYRHKENIQRLRTGEELSVHKKK